MASQVGLTVAQKLAALAAIFPNSTTFYVGFLTTLPTDQAGDGAVEATVSGYARVAITGFSTQELPGGGPGGGDLAALSNPSALTWGALGGALAAVGIGIWSAATGGTLLATGIMTDGGGNPIVRNFVSGDQPNLPAGTLAIGLASISLA